MPLRVLALALVAALRKFVHPLVVPHHGLHFVLRLATSARAIFLT